MCSEGLGTVGEDSETVSEETSSVVFTTGMAFLLNGKTPDFLNPARRLAGVIACNHALLRRVENWNLVITLPGFSSIHSWHTFCQCIFREPNTPTSNGWLSAVV